MPDQPKRPWREGGSQGNDFGEAKRPWRSGDAPLLAKPKGSRKPLLLGLLLATVVLGGLLVFVVTRPRPVPLASMVLIGSDYAENLGAPPNPYGWQGLEDLRQFADATRESFLFWNEPWFNRMKDLEGPFRSRSQDFLLEKLAKVTEKTVVVYVALHGAVDEKGPYLMPDDFDVYPPSDSIKEANVLRVSKLLDALAKLEKKNKVLILDATQVHAHWPLGMLQNDFANQLEHGEIRKQIDNIPNLVVLCASSHRQRSWVCEEWRSTVFGHYVVEGLKGAAGKSGNRITAADLIEYVKENVQKWTDSVANEVQAPLDLFFSKDTVPANIELVVKNDKYIPPQPKEAALAANGVESKLSAAWCACQCLQDQIPPTALRSPLVWRRYLDTLLRYEHFLIAGYDPKNDAKLTKLWSNLEEWKTELQQSLKAPEGLARVYSGALPMYPALGLGNPLAQAELNPRLSTFWEVPDPKDEPKQKDREAFEAELKDQTGQGAILRVGLASVLTHKAAGPEGNPTKTRELLQKLDYGALPRPAESHFLMMLEQDLNAPRRPKTELIRLALEVRLLAERAALAVKDPVQLSIIGDSERVRPWIEKTIEEADKERLLGQDWLFGATEEDWKKSWDHLKKAQQLYEDAQISGEIVRDALAIRDEALAELPYYARWLGSWRPTIGFTPLGSKEKTAEDLLRDFERLSEQTHLLAFRLRQPDPAGINSAPASATGFDPEPLSLKRRSDEVKELLARTKKDFADICLNLKDAQATPLNWHALPSVLSTPFIEPALRLELLKRGQAISKERLDDFDARKAVAPGAVDGWEERKSRQQRLAKAVLGRPWIEQEVKSKTNEGEHVGYHWQRLVLEIRKVAKKIEQGPKESIKDDSSRTIAGDLATTELCCRQLDSGAANLPFDPARENRLLNLHKLLLWQAQRTWDEHWWCTKEEHKREEKPYYVTAVNAYLGAAEALAAISDSANQSNAFNKGMAEMRLAQAKNRGLVLNQKNVEATIQGPKSFDWTTEPDHSLSWKVKAEGVPAGLAMFRLEMGDLLQAAKKGSVYDIRHYREIKEVVEPLEYVLRSQELEAAFAKPPANPSPKRANVKLVGLYRGQPIEEAFNPTLHLVPDTFVYHYPPPKEAYIAVRADKDWHPGSIAIVLDCSGSMGRPENSQQGRYDLVLDALRKVLPTIPEGTNLKVWTFRKPGNDDLIEKIWESKRWEKSQQSGLMATLKNQPLGGWTPLVSAMTKVKEDLLSEKDPPGETSLKTLLVLTDGEDTEFLKNGPQRNEAIRAEIQKQFAGNEPRKRVSLNMVLFQDNQIEFDKAVRQFKDVIIEVNKSLQYPKEKRGWYEPNNVQNLVADLEKVMRPQLALYSGDTLELNKPISLPEENVDFWAALNQPKKVVHYNARILSISPSVRLDPGDALLLLLKQVPGKTFLERALFSDLPLWRDKPRQQHNGWRLAVLRNQHVRDKDKNKLDMLVTMENLNVHPGAGDHLRQTAHGFQWFQLKADGNPQRGLRWGSDWFYPAPAWRLEVGKWQDTGKDKLVPPELDTWWIEDPYPKLHRGLSHNDFKEKGKYRDHDIGGVKDVKVIIESVGIEDRQVGPKGEKASCLIVRLRHDRHKPIWVELRTPNAEARQHLFYDDACKVTAIFWPVTQGEFESGFRLDLTSIEAFKTDAMHFPHTLFKPRLGIPDYSSGPSPQKKSGS